MPARVDRLTPEQEAAMSGWADRWIAVGLSTERADFERFEIAARACYRYAGLPEPKVVVRVPSPLVAVLAGPIAGAMLGGDAVHAAVNGAVLVDVYDAVHGAVHGAVRGAVNVLPASTYRAAIRDEWASYLGGQFWVGGWWGAPAYVSFLVDVCGLELPGDLGDRARAYAETASSASWWWPHRDFIMVADRPLAIHIEPVPGRDRGWGSHRLHNADGPAVVWPDGFAVWSWHGVRVDREVIETPAEQITGERIRSERNAEVRRVLMERIGPERLVETLGATECGTDDWGTLLRVDRPGDTPMAYVRVLNSTPEPDGSVRTYLLRVHPAFVEDREVVSPELVTLGSDGRVINRRTERVPRTPHAAIASTFGLTPDEYRPAVMS